MDTVETIQAAQSRRDTVFINGQPAQVSNQTIIDAPGYRTDSRTHCLEVLAIIGGILALFFGFGFLGAGIQLKAVWGYVIGVLLIVLGVTAFVYVCSSCCHGRSARVNVVIMEQSA